MTTDTAQAPEDTTVHVVVSWGEDEDLWVCRCGEGEYAGTENHFEADIPTALMDDVDRSWSDVKKAMSRIAEAVGVDADDMQRLKECCPEWVGDIHPEKVHYGVVMSGSDGTEWPIRDHTLHYYDDPIQAQEWIDSMPEPFYLHYGAWKPALVTRDRLRVERGGWRGRVSSCHRCGWDRDDHPMPTPKPAGG